MELPKETKISTLKMTRSRVWSLSFSLYSHQKEVKQLQTHINDECVEFFPQEMMDYFNLRVEKILETIREEEQCLQDMAATAKNLIVDDDE